MAAGVPLHLTERHRHLHGHDALTPHSPHTHESIIAMSTILLGTARAALATLTSHDPLDHSHAHFPDIHHRHSH